MALKTAKHSGDTSRAAMARQKIMEKAAELFAERGYGGVGINEVGQTAGFGKGALYYHIRSKEDLLVSIISEHMRRLIDETHLAVGVADDVQGRITAMNGAFVAALIRNPAAMTVCYRDVHAIVETENIEAVRDLHAEYRGLWATALSEGAARAEHREITDVEVDAYVGMLFASIFWVTADTDATALTDALNQTLTGAVVN